MHEPEFLTELPSSPAPCSYLPDQTACMPLSFSHRGVSATQVDELLAAGYRRSGVFYYRTQCPACSACQPLRFAVDKFLPSRSHRRALKLGDRDLRFEINAPRVDARRLDLFNQHRTKRGLCVGDGLLDAAGYSSFLIESANEVIELSIWIGDKLVAVAIADVAKCSLSAVYCFFDPAYSNYSLGTYAILKQWQLAKTTGRTWLYLGMYVAANSHLSYKARFVPHQRWIDQQWQVFEKNA